jgi:RNA polymerase sigma factor (sigma-70 family)
MTSQKASFDEFIRRIRAGDAEAAVELVRRYEALIRREIRLHMRDRRLNRVFESRDVCQAVLGSFFARAALGQYDLETPENLVKLLMAMARNKLATAARRQGRDGHRTIEDSEAIRQFADPAAAPTDVLAERELLERFHAALSAEEAVLADLRTQGIAWDEIARQVGGTAGACRMQLARAIERASRQIGLR